MTLPVVSRLAAAVVISVALAACAETLPDEDRRIYADAPVAKLSADILWKDYTTDAAAADRLYWGKAIEVSGDITEVSSEPPHAFLAFGQNDTPGVRAVLLGDEAAAIVAAAKVGDRITLRCYCEGFTEFVRLRSCIARH